MLGDTVIHILQTYGSDLTLTRPSGTRVYNTGTGKFEGGTPANFTIRGVFVDYKEDRVNGTSIRSGDRMLLVSATGSETAPAIGDAVDGMTIVHVRAFSPNGNAIAWTAQTRK